MARVQNGDNAESFNSLSIGRTNITDRQTTDGFAIAKTQTYST